MKSETVSEKPRRGRPPIVSEWEEQSYKALGMLTSKAKSRRSLHNAAYRQDACVALGMGHEPEFTWLLNRDAQKFGKEWQAGILTELGRLRNPDKIRAAAARVCELKPSAKEGVRMVRAWRLGGLPKGSASQLTGVLAVAIDDYMGGHQVTWEEVAEALRSVTAAVEKQR